MFSLEYIYTLIILMGSGFLYRRFIDKYDNDDLREYKLIKNIYYPIHLLPRVINLFYGFIFHMK